MSLSSDPDKIRAWKQRSAKKYEKRVRDEVLAGERPWNSIPPVNPERRKRERERAYGPEERREWIRNHPSVLSGKTPCVNAHVPPVGDLSGMSRKADAEWVVPLTDAEHRELHRIGRDTFEALHVIDLAVMARVIDAEWQDYIG